MARKKSGSGWSGVSGWGALLLGLGGVLPSGEQAIAAFKLDTNTASLRADGDKIYLSQGGASFEELKLGDTPEARHLRKLLRDAGGGEMTVPVGSFIVANGGASHPGSKPGTVDGTAKPGKKKPVHRSTKRNGVRS